MAAPPPPPGFPVAGAPFVPPVPPPWTEHRAPGGQPYWFNPITNVSTYTRPGPPPPPAGFPVAGLPPPPPGFPIAAPPPGFPIAPSTAVPPAQLPPLHFTAQSELKPEKKKEKKEKPKEKLPIEGTPWIRVTTNKGNVFYSQKETKESVWTVPEEIKEQVEAIEAKEKEEREKVEREEEEERAAAAVAVAPKKRKAVDDEGEDAASEAAVQEDDEQVKGDLDLEIEGANGASSSALPEKPSSPAVESAGDQPKKKKQKKRVVTSLEELQTDDLMKEDTGGEKAENGEPQDGEEEDDEEAWQRQIAEEMAREAAGGAEESAATATGEVVEPAPKPGNVPHVDQVEAAALFKVLLGEKDINPMAPFETELPKFVGDPRYHAVTNNRDRRDMFEEFCKEKIREQRAAKKKLAESGKKVDPLTAFRALLTSAVTSTRTHFSDFKRAHSRDPRFREFGKTEGDREKEFKKFLRELGEKKRAQAEKAEKEFKEMLVDDREIRQGDKWADVKKRHANDPRYVAVNSSSLREQLFAKHVSSLSSSSSARPTASSSTSSSAPSKAPAPSKEDKAARAAASLREREEKVRLDKMKQDRDAMRARGNLGKEEAEREFGQLLVDQVRDHKAHFDDLAPALSRDPRFDAPSLHPFDKRRLFDQHLQKLYTTRLAAVESLFAQHSPKLTTPFHDVLPAISTDPHVVRFVGEDFDKLEGLYTSWQTKREKKAREDFQQMLKENAMIQHWGRAKKMATKEKVELIGQEGKRNDEVDEEDEEVGMGEMAQQVGLKQIHAVLRQDARYLAFAHLAEERDRWIEDYVDNLAAPNMTLHQRE
ncbi:hypothetical protein JCM11251_003633 [Rhodosporidiobolus azoricus]